jgi:hypothetical protein
MASRVNDTEVKEIITTSLDTTPFIIAANALVTEILGDDTTIGATMLKEIERWLAAHFTAISDPRAHTESLGEASVKYALAIYNGPGGLELKSTPYGQQVLILDFTGKMSRLGKRRTTFQVIDES